MRLPRPSLNWVFGFAIAMAGCKPEIGDACTLHSDCSATGTRLCDSSFTGGYCTIFNCSPNKCPDEARCVAYGTVLSSVPECAEPSAGLRLERTFCMRACSSNGDCRTADGYACVDLSDPAENPWGAAVVDRGAGGNKVCTKPAPGAAQASGHDSQVCSPPLDASFPPEPDGAVARDAAPDGPGADVGARDGGGDGAARDAGRGDGGPRDGAARDASPPGQDAASGIRDAQGGS